MFTLTVRALEKHEAEGKDESSGVDEETLDAIKEHSFSRAQMRVPALREYPILEPTSILGFGRIWKDCISSGEGKSRRV